ncbi:hypothetical protein CUS07_03525 [Enterococcus faecalis]|nr:hypothetical protein [Enterococcus faecalis]PQE38356.1 hypothetical protein CUS33_00540 [Enterococcus faecalis]PQE60847.1 hypothetical protein CUS07_03525 [Enterococcus faecalis]PQE66232.1 hypothetical protein CUS03_08340 [Enterococcus faecalis]PQF01603.1 hypothetical protein CUS90_00165 [Enterococcus faecalis]
MFFNFWRILAYFRKNCFCSRSLSNFKPGTKITLDFCPRLIFTTHQPLLTKSKKTLLYSFVLQECLFILNNFLDFKHDNNVYKIQ